jgi:hypothetical protein
LLYAPISPATRFLFHRYGLQINREAAEAGIAPADDGIAVASGGHIRIDNYRMANVLFSEYIKPMLAKLGGRLTRAELDRGDKTDTQFWNAVAIEYNNADKIEYGELAHDVKWPGNTKPNPAVFSRITATRLMESYKNLTKEYDIIISKWKKSGNHENDLPQPISDFTDRYIIRYFHEFVHGHPDILSTVLKDLPPGVFSESTSNGRKRKGDHNRRNSKAASTHDEAIANMAVAQEGRNKSMANMAASQKAVHASQDILNKTKAVTDAEDRISQMQDERRSRIVAMGGKEELAKLREAESQDSRCEEIDQLEERIKSTKKRLATALKAYEDARLQPPASPSA